jgi:hypothetical protein
MLDRISLRIASALAFFHAVMHQVGMMQETTDAAEIALVNSMRSYQANVMGSMRSYMDFYSGLGIYLTITLLCFAIVLWLVSRGELAARQSNRPLLLTIGLAFLAFAAISVRYFFIAPVVMQALIAVFVLLAWFNSRAKAA